MNHAVKISCAIIHSLNINFNLLTVLSLALHLTSFDSNKRNQLFFLRLQFRNLVCWLPYFKRTNVFCFLSGNLNVTS